MNGCEGFEIAIEMRLHGAADQDASGRLDAHLATCEACRQFENEVKTSEKTMRERARPLESSFDDARLRAKIRHAQRNPWITPRTVLALFSLDGLSHREIAETLGIPEGTVWSRLHLARKKLTAELKALGFDMAT